MMLGLSFITFLKRMKIFNFFQQIQNALSKPFIPCITLGLKKLSCPDTQSFSKIIPQIEPLNTSIQVELDFDKSTNTLLGVVKFEDHVIKLLGNSSHLPEYIIETCIHTAHWQTEFKEQILLSKATVTLVYAGNSNDPIENYIALYKVAACFYDENLLGVINEPAWTYHPSGLLPKTIFNNMVNLCRNSPPFLFWTGFIKTSLDVSSPFSSNKTNCFFTKGHHVFGIPDFAYFSDDADPMKVKKLFNDII